MFGNHRNGAPQILGDPGDRLEHPRAPAAEGGERIAVSQRP